MLDRLQLAPREEFYGFQLTVTKLVRSRSFSQARSNAALVKTTVMKLASILTDRIVERFQQLRARVCQAELKSTG